MVLVKLVIRHSLPVFGACLGDIPIRDGGSYENDAFSV